MAQMSLGRECTLEQDTCEHKRSTLFCSDFSLALRLVELSRMEGADLYQSYVVRAKRSVTEIMAW